MRRNIDEDAPTVEWAKPGRAHVETPLGGVELAMLRSKDSAGWDAQTFAVRLPVEHEGPSRLVAMSIAALLSFVIGLATFLLVMRLQAHHRADVASTEGMPSLAMMPLVEEGVPVPSPIPAYDPTAMPSSLGIGFMPTGDVLAPPDPRMPEGGLVMQAPASPIVPYTSAAPAPRPQHAATAPTVRKGRKAH